MYYMIHATDHGKASGFMWKAYKQMHPRLSTVHSSALMHLTLRNRCWKVNDRCAANHSKQREPVSRPSLLLNETKLQCSLQLDFHVHARWEVQFHQGIDSLVSRIDDVH